MKNCPGLFYAKITTFGKNLSLGASLEMSPPNVTFITGSQLHPITAY